LGLLNYNRSNDGKTTKLACTKLTKTNKAEGTNFVERDIPYVGRDVPGDLIQHLLCGFTVWKDSDLRWKVQDLRFKGSNICK